MPLTLADAVPNFMSRVGFVRSARRQKTHRDENFPVASLLISPARRPAILAFYRFARAADDVADDPKLSPEDKLLRLCAMETALSGLESVNASVPAELTDLARALHAAAPRHLHHASQLLEAFRKDSVQNRCRDFAELMTYCRYSAAPVGRFLIDLHGESADLYPAADALCAALQILNHLQDCREDYLTLDRVYLPLDWLWQEGADLRDLEDGSATPELRRALDRLLDAVDGLIETARPLPGGMADRGLRMEAATILGLAERLSQLLRRNDPIARPVKLAATDFALGAVFGLARGWRPGVK